MRQSIQDSGLSGSASGGPTPLGFDTSENGIDYHYNYGSDGHIYGEGDTPPPGGTIPITISSRTMSGLPVIDITVLRPDPADDSQAIRETTSSIPDGYDGPLPAHDSEAFKEDQLLKDMPRTVKDGTDAALARLKKKKGLADWRRQAQEPRAPRPPVPLQTLDDVEPVAEEATSGLPLSPPVLVAAAVVLLMVLVGGYLLFGRGGSTGSTTATGAGAPAAAAPAVGLQLNRYTMDLKFSMPTFGACPASAQKATPSDWGGSWIFAVMPGAGTDVAVNLKPGANSPFGNYLNGPLRMNGKLMVSGDSSIENQVLKITIAQLTLASIKASMAVTGSTDVTLHSTMGECHASYRAAGSIDPPK